MAGSCRARSCPSRSRSTTAWRTAPTVPGSRRPSFGDSSAPSSSCSSGEVEPAMTDERRDAWSSGDAYEPYVGRWSRLVARAFVGWLGLPDDLRWLDVGCGTGALTETIVARCSPSAVVGVDRSEEYLAYARARVADGRGTFKIG